MKRVVVVSDLHCGHLVGLTPPGWQLRGNNHSGKRTKFLKIQRECWRWYENILKELHPIYLLVCNGDAIDGKGTRSGGSEQITTDLEEQAQMAKVALSAAKAEHIVLTYGTAYHASPEGEDWENVLAIDLKADKIGSHEWIEVDGVVIDCKHHVGSSSVPYGRHTAVAKENTWNILWNEHDLQPRADIIIRSHVHFFNYCGGNGWLGMTTPPLQAMGTKYGSRRCTGLVDFGLVTIDIENGEYTWEAHIAKLEKQKAKALQL